MSKIQKLGLLAVFAFDTDGVHFHETELPAKSAGSVRIVWWNIQFGKTNSEIKSRSSQDPLNDNISMLVKSDAAPDIIAFGEYEPESLSESTQRTMRKAYPYSPKDYWPYNSDSPERGIAIFSKIPIESIRAKTLDYYPLEMQDPKLISEYKAGWAKNFPPERMFPRPYIKIQFKIGEDEFYFLPFHGLMHAEKEFLESGGGFLTMTWLKIKMTFSGETPMIYQLRRFRNELERDFSNLASSKLIVIGDFNLPRKVFGLTTKPYGVASKDLVDPLAGSELASWPLPSSEEYRRFSIRGRIDHSFASKSIEIVNTFVPHLQGSDHAPLILDIKI